MRSWSCLCVCAAVSGILLVPPARAEDKAATADVERPATAPRGFPNVIVTATFKDLLPSIDNADAVIEARKSAIRALAQKNGIALTRDTMEGFTVAHVSAFSFGDSGVRQKTAAQYDLTSMFSYWLPDKTAGYKLYKLLEKEGGNPQFTANEYNAVPVCGQ